MRVCWDAEVGVRAPCGALSGQDSWFLPISRMIMGLPDNALPPGAVAVTEPEELRERIEDSWRLVAPKRVARAFLAEG
jgi:hypothetical protein